MQRGLCNTSDMIDPEFVPSVPEPSVEERAYAWNAFDDALHVRLSTQVEDMPDDIRDIIARDNIVRHERAIFMRDDTKIIPERMLDPEKPLEFKDILAMLNVYFWWNDNEYEPAPYLKYLLKDLDDKRFAEAVRALHYEFQDLCSTYEPGRRQGVDHQSDGFECFVKYLRVQGSEKKLKDPQKRAEEAISWLEGVDATEDEDENEVLGVSTLRQVLARYIVDTLILEGTDVIEAQDALNVLHHEEERRVGTSEEYEELRASFESGNRALEDWLPEFCATNDKVFEMVMEGFDNLPADVRDWDHHRKVALAKRAIEDELEDFRLLEISYQMHQKGFIPYYVRRFAEEFWPPDQRV